MYHRRLTAGVNAARAVRSARAGAPAVRPTPSSRPAAAQTVAQRQMPQTRSLQTSSCVRDLHAQAQEVIQDEGTSGLGSHAAAEKKIQDAEAAASFSGALRRRTAKEVGGAVAPRRLRRSQQSDLC